MDQWMKGSMNQSIHESMNQWITEWESEWMNESLVGQGGGVHSELVNVIDVVAFTIITTITITATGSGTTT